MRLINVDTLEMQEFGDSEVLYAILSHTWEEEEVTFEDYKSIEKVEGSLPSIVGLLNYKKGLKKLLGWCNKARKEGFHWIWIDTCCIDKASSAELSEAINAMYAWYAESGICYAYLSDVRSDEDPTSTDSSFRNSRWFTRGWTLQELIAPSEVIFLACDWKEIGTRRSLSRLVSEITNIEERVLHKPSVRRDFSLAQRMSWASRRRTTRIEDLSYCLMVSNVAGSNIFMANGKFSLYRRFG
jgi:hypothetical protein